MKSKTKKLIGAGLILGAGWLFLIKPADAETLGGQGGGGGLGVFGTDPAQQFDNRMSQPSESPIFKLPSVNLTESPLNIPQTIVNYPTQEIGQQKSTAFSSSGSSSIASPTKKENKLTADTYARDIYSGVDPIKATQDLYLGQQQSKAYTPPSSSSSGGSSSSGKSLARPKKTVVYKPSSSGARLRESGSYY